VLGYEHVGSPFDCLRVMWSSAVLAGSIGWPERAGACVSTGWETLCVPGAWATVHPWVY